MTKKLILIPAALAVLFLSASCGFLAELWAPADLVKDQQGGASSSSGAVSSSGAYVPKVYIGGYYVDSFGTTFACYWVDGIRYTNASFSTSNSCVNSIAFSGNNIVLGGFYTPSVQHGFYWITNYLFELNTPSWPSEIKSICVYQGIIYSAGTSNDMAGNTFACFGSNAIFNQMTGTPGVPNSAANSIFGADTGNFYVAGHTNYGACYWVNNSSPVKLSSDFSWANTIFVTNWIVDVGGYSNNYAFLTTNNVFSNLSGVDTGEINSVYISGSRIYSAGYTNSSEYYACYWTTDTNGTVFHDLSSGNPSKVYSIFVYGTNVYACGYTGTAGIERACYWVNGTLIDISGNTNTIAKSIYIK